MLAPTIQVKQTRKLLNEFKISEITDDDLYLDLHIPAHIVTGKQIGRASCRERV